MYRLIIFDFDGTLADSGPWMLRILNEMIPLFELPPTSVEELEAMRGLSTPEIIRRLRVPLWKLPAMAHFVRGRMAADADQVRLFEGVPAMLASLKARGVRLAVVSANAEETIRRVLGDSAAHIDDFACGVDLFGKAPRFRKVMKRAKVAAAETLCIGDETRDIEAARTVEAAAGAVVWGYATAAALEALSPTVVFRSLDEIVALG